MPQDQDDIKGADAMKQGPNNANRECKDCGAYKPARNAVCAFCGLSPTAPVEDVSTKSPETNMSPEHVKETAENKHVAAPVEASGSEREAWACVDFNPDLRMSGEGYCLRCGRHQDEHARPQPSGETREALNVALAEHDHWIKEALKHKRPKGLRSDCENRDLERARIAKRIADKIAALRPAPVASGGQHSSGEVVEYDPPMHDGFYMHEDGTRLCWMQDGALSFWVPYPPVPAQDDDKLRIAVEALEPFADFVTPAPKWMNDVDVVSAGSPLARKQLTFGDCRRAAEALAALKSTAAQEGGK